MEQGWVGTGSKKSELADNRGGWVGEVLAAWPLCFWRCERGKVWSQYQSRTEEGKDPAWGQASVVQHAHKRECGGSRFFCFFFFFWFHLPGGCLFISNETETHLLPPLSSWSLLRGWTRQTVTRKVATRASLVTHGEESACQCRGTGVWSLVWEDPTCQGTMEPVCCSYWSPLAWSLDSATRETTAMRSWCIATRE